MVIAGSGWHHCTQSQSSHGYVCGVSVRFMPTPHLASKAHCHWEMNELLRELWPNQTIYANEIKHWQMMGIPPHLKTVELSQKGSPPNDIPRQLKQIAEIKRNDRDSSGNASNSIYIKIELCQALLVLPFFTIPWSVSIVRGLIKTDAWIIIISATTSLQLSSIDMVCRF